MASAPQLDPVSTKQQRIAQLARQRPQEGFTSLNHHLDLAWLAEAYSRTRKDAAPGVDGQTAEQYGLQLLENLQGLLGRARSGTYRAPPVRRVYIPKGTGPELRPLGIPTLEDKVLQRAVVMVLEAVSRVLPDTTYVTELHVEGDKMQVAGLTQDAPSLIKLIEQSPQFTRATFFAPTTRSQNDPGERFHIEAHITPYFGSGS